MQPILYVVVPCYNEEDVLPITSELLFNKLTELIQKEKISSESKILMVDDGSEDNTWHIISNLAESNQCFLGIRQSRNRGHQSTLLAGLMEVKDRCDISISIDCDGQDDINAMDEMIEKYLEGCDVVYGVRNNRQTDTLFKKCTAECFYKLMRLLGVKIVFNSADYRLISSKVLKKLADFEEVNLFLRGLLPLIGYKSDIVYYKRNKRVAGKSHYPLSKMFALAIDGITSFSPQPLRLIACFGFLVAFLSFVGVLWSVLTVFFGKTVPGWASMTSIICFVSGVQLICMGILGEYISKIYLETKARPRYIISEKTYED